MDVKNTIIKCKTAYPEHKLITMGDMNAHTQGYYSESTNANGRLLIELCKSRNLAIIPYQGPTFERGESKSAIDYILVERANYHNVANADILDR